MKQLLETLNRNFSEANKRFSKLFELALVTLLFIAGVSIYLLLWVLALFASIYDAFCKIKH